MSADGYKAVNSTAAAEGRPLWMGLVSRAKQWEKILDASGYLIRAIKIGVRDSPSVPFTRGEIMPPVPQSEEDRRFAFADLSAGLVNGVYEEVSWSYVQGQLAQGKMVSSAFTTWRGEGANRKGRFVINLHRQSKHWPHRGVKMETLSSFSVSVEQNDHLMSWDFMSGYRHLRLHRDMRDYFLFQYGGKYYRCVALPFGWGPSALWFTKLMRPLVRYLRSQWAWRVLPYLDDFLLAPSPCGRAATKEDCALAITRLERLFRRLGLHRHPNKGCWDGAQQLDHLGAHIDNATMRITVAAEKVNKVRRLARRLVALAHRNRRLVPISSVRSFCGVCVSLSLALPLARFHTRSLYWDMAEMERVLRLSREEQGKIPQLCRSVSRGGAEDRNTRSHWVGGVRLLEAQTSSHWDRRTYCRQPFAPSERLRLSRQSLRDLSYWSSFTPGDGRSIRPPLPSMAVHSDASRIAYGGTLGDDLRQGTPGEVWAQGFWTSDDRCSSITLLELRAVRLLLADHFARFVKKPHVQRLLLHEDNQAVVAIINSMVSASKPMMSELRKLHDLLRSFGITISAKWIPSAVNKFADSLSRTWDPGDIRVTQKVIDSLTAQYNLDEAAFRYRPLNEPLPVRRSYISEQLLSRWDDGRARLWTPPFDLLPLVLHKLRVEGGHGLLVEPQWTAQPWYKTMEHLSSRIHVLPGPLDRAVSGLRVNSRWRLVVAEIVSNPTGLPAYTTPICPEQALRPQRAAPRRLLA